VIDFGGVGNAGRYGNDGVIGRWPRVGAGLVVGQIQRGVGCMARIVESLAREGKRNDAGEKIVNSDESYAVLLDRVLRERPQGALLELCERLAESGCLECAQIHASLKNWHNHTTEYRASLTFDLAVRVVEAEEALLRECARRAGFLLVAQPSARVGTEAQVIRASARLLAAKSLALEKYYKAGRDRVYTRAELAAIRREVDAMHCAAEEFYGAVEACAGGDDDATTARVRRRAGG